MKHTENKNIGNTRKIVKKKKKETQNIFYSHSQKEQMLQRKI